MEPVVIDGSVGSVSPSPQERPVNTVRASVEARTRRMWSNLLCKPGDGECPASFPKGHEGLYTGRGAVVSERSTGHAIVEAKGLAWAMRWEGLPSTRAAPASRRNGATERRKIALGPSIRVDFFGNIDQILACIDPRLCE